MQRDLRAIQVASRLAVSHAAIVSWCRDGRFLGARYDHRTAQWMIPVPVKLHPKVGRSLAVLVSRSVVDVRRK